MKETREAGRAVLCAPGVGCSEDGISTTHQAHDTSDAPTTCNVTELHEPPRNKAPPQVDHERRTNVKWTASTLDENEGKIYRSGRKQWEATTSLFNITVKPEMSVFPEANLNAAAFLFESARGNVLGSGEFSDVVTAELKDVDPSHIADQIRHSLDTTTELSIAYRSTAFWALGKRFDPNLRDFFRRHLAVELNHDMHVAYQIMIALEDLGESVWREPTSCSVVEVEQNRMVAFQYLNEGV